MANRDSGPSREEILEHMRCEDPEWMRLMDAAEDCRRETLLAFAGWILLKFGGERPDRNG